MIIENTLPGVTAQVNTGQVSRPLRRQPTSNAFVIGFAPWGPIGVRKVISNWGEYLRTFGGFHSLGYLADFAHIFFNLFAGRTIVAVRAGGPAAAAATETVDNRVAETPAATFKFDAKYPSSTVDVSLEIVDTPGSTAAVDITIISEALKITEIYKAVDLRVASELAALNAKSRLVVVSLAAATVAGGTGRPAAGMFELAGGDDDSASVATDDLAAYLSQFADENLGTGQVCIPGHYSEANQVALIAHAVLYNRLVLLEHELGTDYDVATADLNEHPSSHAAAYFPWVEMKSIDGDGLKFYPPTCFAAGACAQVDRTIGTHKAPANLTVPNAVDVERNADGTSMINDSVRQYLNARNINAIGPIQGEGIKVYGARVLAPAGETRVQWVHERRVLNLIYYTAKLGYAWAVFQVIDGAGRLFRDLKSSGSGFLRQIWRDGALYGRSEAEAFVVIADETNNSPEDLELGVVHVQLGVKISPTAEQVMINIDSVPLSQNLNVLNGGEN